MRLTRTKRVVLAVYGVGATFVFLWVPWRGYESPIYQVPKDRWRSTFLGYGLVWSRPEPPASFVKYETEADKYSVDYAEYQRLHASDCPPDWVKSDPVNIKSGFVGGPPGLEVGVLPDGETKLCVPKSPGYPPPLQKPEAPEGYILPVTYRWADLDYEKVLLEFGALSSLLLVVWMLTSFADHVPDQN
jgi:hypothetical protein